MNKSRNRRLLSKRRKALRGLKLENLEQRQLLAGIPQLAGIQPNNGSLLLDGDVRNVAPQDLTFLFQEGAAIDPATLGAIQVVRSGFDGTFERAALTSTLNTAGIATVQFTSQLDGQDGNAITLSFTQSDHGNASGPTISVDGLDISIDLNTNSQNPSDVNDLIDALNTDPDSSDLVFAEVVAGNPDVTLVTQPLTFSPLQLTGANDVVLDPGFVGEGDSSREIIFRFQENLPDDTYRINIDATGDIPLADLDGSVFNDGEEDFELNFELDLGAQITSVIPQPIRRDADTGALTQELDTIEVFFNNDDLDPITAEDPAFYQLILTRDSVENIDDVVYLPTSVNYDADADMATLKFASNLDELIDPTTSNPIQNGTFRLRIGTDEAAPERPIATNITNDPGSSFHTALNVGVNITVTGGGNSFAEGDTFTLTDDQGTVHTFEFDTGMVIQVPGLGVADGETFAINDGTTTFFFEFDSDGVFVDVNSDLIPDNILISITGGETPAELGALIAAAIDGVGNLTAIEDGSGRVQVTGSDNISADFSSTALTSSGAPGAQTAGANPIFFRLGDSVTPEDMVASIVSAINSAGLPIQAGQIDNRITFNNVTEIDVDDIAPMEKENFRSVVLSSTIEPLSYELEWPGSNDEPGHRVIREENHLLIGADNTNGVRTLAYNFINEYGFDPNGNVLFNAITETQKQRTREIFEIYSEMLGAQFVETDNLGFTIVTGDMRPLGEINGPGGVLGVAGGNLAIMDLQDFSNPGDDRFGGPWFETAMHEIGHLLGLGHNYELPPGTIMGSEPELIFDNRIEPVFPGDHDIVHGRHLYRPESYDIDLYRIELVESGTLSAETFAERLSNPSLLDSVINVYKEVVDDNGNLVGRELISRNDDYYSEDAFVKLDLEAGVYFIGVSASGNNQYDPTIEDSGFDGTSQGQYDLRVTFNPRADNNINDLTGNALDGDSDGVAGGVFNFWFRTATQAGAGNPDDPRTIFVDKASTGINDGSLIAPFNNLQAAVAAADPGDIIRVLGNPGADNDITTVADNLAYEVGFSRLTSRVLDDGPSLVVPQDVTLMVDHGAIFKLRRSRIGVGSTTPAVDLSAGSIQVLGAPVVRDADGNVIRDAAGNPVVSSVIFTSLHDDERGIDNNPDATPPAAAPGDWGGIHISRDLDGADDTRFSYADEGIFLDSINHAEFLYGGGSVFVDGNPTIISPVDLTDARPLISHNDFSFSAEAAISMNPDSAAETNFHSPPFQATPFTSDYDRVGPEIHNNLLFSNSIDGLFIDISVPSINDLERLTVAGRWNDTDIVHVISENLEINGTPGGPTLEQTTPPIALVIAEAQPGGSLSAGTYNYRITFVDAAGNEGAPSTATADTNIDGTVNGSVRLKQLPPAPAGFVARRIYRSTDTGNGPYTRVAQINATDTQFVDDGTARGGTLEEFAFKLRARLDASLVIDAGTVVKLDGARIETLVGAQLVAEGQDGREVVFTSLRDGRFGGSGSFNTGRQTTNPAVGGDWAGIFAGEMSTLSLDHAIVAYGGGITKVEGDFSGFNAIEIYQAEARIAHSHFEFNADGVGGSAPDHRFGRGFNEPGTIFVRGAQPVIIDNVMIRNDGPAININVNALNSDLNTDYGRQTGHVEFLDQFRNNQGPLIRLNRLDDNALNGIVIRGETLTTQGVWDDTDIVHTLQDSIYVSDHHTFGGLRLESSPEESLVVKALGEEIGITGTGRALDINDRFGGSVQIIGQPRAPVVITSLEDCTVGAGFQPNGQPQHDTLETGACAPIEDSEIGAVDVVVLMDESGSMGFAQAFSVQMIADLEAALLAAGVGRKPLLPNQYGLVGFGASDPNAKSLPVGPNGELFGSSTEYATAAQGLVTDGATEDGYQAIHLAADDYPWRPEATQFMILVTDEPRDAVDNSLDFANTLTAAQGVPAIVHGIHAVNIVDGNGVRGLAIDKDGNTFTADGNGGFTTSPNGTITDNDGATIDDYVDLEFATDGIAGDISQIQLGGATTASFSRAMVSRIVAQAGGNLNIARPGDWDGLRLEQYGGDRNVDIIVESEPEESGTRVDANMTPDSAQILGELAPDEKSGDDIRRLAFEVHGNISRPSDVDVYSFTADAGTEVWFDIDRTTHSLDTIVELVDADGNVLVRSDNSVDEDANTAGIFRTDIFPDEHINSLRKNAFEINDLYTTNPRDAGMRVVLHGAPGTTNVYHIRVRSNGDNLDVLDGGKTSGVYQLQVRVRETDEIPGSTVKNSDLRYANNAIQILGQPIHSPLLGEIGEDITDNQVPGDAQQVGNILNSDRGTVSVAGRLDDFQDADFFEFEVLYDSIQTPPGTYVATSFDIDYADGLGRPNTTLWIFDEQQELILGSFDSNIADDRPGDPFNNDIDDLSRGSVGSLDVYLGTVELPVGTYFAAVTPVGTSPVLWQQFTQPDPPNTLVRAEPVNSVRRIVDDHIDFQGGATAEDPIVPVFIDDSTFVPFHLGDVVLFTSRDSGFERTTLDTVDGFVGTHETQVGAFPHDVGDIAMRSNGEIFSFTLDLENLPSSDDDTGNFLHIDAGNGAILNDPDDEDDEIETFELDGTNVVTANLVGNQRLGHGIHFQALTFHDEPGGPTRLYGVGSRPDGAVAPGVPPENMRNILYWFNPDTGEAISAPAGDRTDDARIQGAATQIVERGILDTGDEFDTSGKQLIATEATQFVNGVTTRRILDGTQFVVDDDNNPFTPGIVFEMNAGPEWLVHPDPDNGIFVRDADTFVLDGITYEFNTGSILVVTGSNGTEVADGGTFTITDDEGRIRTFEIDRNNSTSGNNIPVPVRPAMNSSQIATQIAAAINGVDGYNVVASELGNRVTLENDRGNASSAGLVGVEIQGDDIVQSGNIEILAEETFDAAQFGGAVVTTFAGISAVTASQDGARLNFAGAQNGTFTNIVNRGVITDLGSSGSVTAGAVAVSFLSSDSAATIADRIRNELQRQGMGATAADEVVTLLGLPVFESATNPLRVGGNPPGGDITGVAFVNNTMFAVTDTGGLFIINNPSSPLGAFATYIPSSAPDLKGINFQGLESGPVDVENGRYSNLLFGITGGGEIHAFDTLGRLQPIFADGATSVDTGLGQVNGLAFSTLDENLWQTNPGGRGNDAGHGLNASFDGSRTDFAGSSSLHFGPGRAGGGVCDRRECIDFPGGAHGTVESHEFSLQGISSADLPYLYFNYLADTEEQSTASGPMRDSFRVFITDASGQWELLGTNNSNAADELAIDTPFQVQELYDNKINDNPAWRQFRFDLSPYAGHTDMRIRFDFSTAGEMNVGDAATVGSELRAVDAINLEDGDVFTIDDTDFEFEFGITLIAPSGGSITDGDTFTVDFGQGPRVFEFSHDDTTDVGNIPVPVNIAMSAANVATAIDNAIALFIAAPVIPVDLNGTESNDTLNLAVAGGIGSGTRRISTSGLIGSNAALLDPNLDVDLIEVEVERGGRIVADIDANINGGTFDSHLRIFDSEGNELASNDNGQAPGEFFSADSFLDFTAPRHDTYYIGVSGAGNDGYNPEIAGSGRLGSLGTYDIDVQITDPLGFAQRTNHLLQLPGAVDATSNSNVIVTGDVGTDGVPVRIHRNQNENQVATAIRFALADVFANREVDTIKGHKEMVRIINHEITEQGPLGATVSLPGDGAGAFNSNLRGQNNQFEGVYIDDIIIGATEHGEMITAAGTFASWDHAEIDTEIQAGEYQLEIRRSEEYGEPLSSTTIELIESFNTNDRLTEASTIVAPNGWDVIEGQTFTIGDGNDVVTFEYDDMVNANNGVAQGHIAIGFDPSDTNQEMAVKIRDAINSPAVQAVLDVTAGSGDGPLTGTVLDPTDFDAVGNFTTSRLINLYGNAIINFTRLEVTETTQDGNRLRDAILGEGITAVGDARFVGSEVSAGFFRGGATVLGMANGIVLATGDANAAEGPNRSDETSGLASEIGDADLDLEFATETLDTTSLEFDFEVTGGSDDLFFRFVFASEEYNEFANSEFNDVFGFFLDGQNIALLPSGLPISINTVNGGNPLGFDPQNSQFYINNDPNDDGVLLNELGYDGLTTVFTLSALDLAPGTHTIKLSISDVGDERLDSAVFIQAGSFSSDDQVVELPTEVRGVLYDHFGDTNTHRDQGQLVISGNTIRHSDETGILVDAGFRDGPEGTPHAGPPRHLHAVNDVRLAPGVTLVNNTLAYNTTGIHFGGDPNPANEQLASVPFGRIINNTVFGGMPDTVGIEVHDNASPTLLNNIVANHLTGLDIDSTSETTVLGGTLYAQNELDFTNATIGEGTFPIVLEDTDPLFVDPANYNFYLAPLSRAIDSSIDSLQDRPEMISLKSPLGIGLSPIKAPSLDGTGQERVDDPQVDTLSGLGENVFKDRGAIDRADFAGPTVVLLTPRDNDAEGVDTDDRASIVELSRVALSVFEIQILDGTELNNSVDGIGPDDNTVTPDSVIVFRDGDRLQRGVDYSFSYDSTSNIIRLFPLSGIWPDDSTYVIELTNTDGFVISPGDGSTIADGDTFTVEDKFGGSVDFEFDSGYTVFVPQGLQLELPEDGGSAIRDGETFTIDDGSTEIIFEFDRNGVTQGGTAVIRYNFASDVDVIANQVVLNLINANIGLTPKHLGEGVVYLGAGENHVLDTDGTTATQSGRAGVVVDGQTFNIDDGFKTVTFEFDSDEDLTDANNVLLPFNNGQTHEEIASTMANVIAVSNVALSPTHFGDGVLHLGGTIRHMLDLTNAPTLTSTGVPGVRPAFGVRVPTQDGQVVNITDGETWTLGDGVNPAVVFEFDDDGTATAGNGIISFTASSTANDIANRIVGAVQQFGIGVTPRNEGDGIVSLNGSTTAHVLDVRTSGLLALGSPGVDAAVPVPFVPHESFDETLVARSITDAVNGSDLMEVIAINRIDTVVLNGAFNVTGINGQFVPSIKDLASNALQPNQTNGATTFTIFLGAGLDYGDAPESYGTLKANDGPRHLVQTGFFLGADVNSEVDGQPSSSADADQHDDGVVFTSDITAGIESFVTITVSGASAEQPGFIDAWIDFNNDGDFDDAGEQIFTSEPVVEGDNDLTFIPSVTAELGDTYARFRLSSTGALTPIGPATEGEVEDYQVAITGNPWRNPLNPLDVNTDTFVSPIDALLVVNFLNENGSIELPIPPIGFPTPLPRVDVNGDGSVSPIDALLVINHLNAPPGGGEGEGEALSIDPLQTNVEDRPIIVAPPVQQDDENDREEEELVEIKLATAEPPQQDYAEANNHLEQILFGEIDDVLDDLVDDVEEASKDSDAHDDFFSNF